jgi:bifunctional non-homologous end joining protein LigD
VRNSTPPAPTLSELRPMLLCERKTIPREPGWHFEFKYDGYRHLARTGDPAVRLREGGDATSCFPELHAPLAALPVAAC